MYRFTATRGHLVIFAFCSRVRWDSQSHRTGRHISDALCGESHRTGGHILAHRTGGSLNVPSSPVGFSIAPDWRAHSDALQSGGIENLSFYYSKSTPGFKMCRFTAARGHMVIFAFCSPVRWDSQSHRTGGHISDALQPVGELRIAPDWWAPQGLI